LVTEEPTEPPIIPTEEPTPDAITVGEPTTDDIIVFPPPECPDDVQLLSTVGVTEFPPIDASAVQVLSKDTSTVTVALNNVWDSSGPIGSMYYEYMPDSFDTKCYEEEDVAVGATYAEFTISCSHLVPQARLKICLADPIQNEFLVIEDNATLPKCCQSTEESGTPIVCYSLEISCKPGCPEEDAQAV